VNLLLTNQDKNGNKYFSKLNQNEMISASTSRERAFA
jgi:hypothetical protein